MERGHGRRRWAGRRGQQPWSEYVDGEEFLEALLLVVLQARVRTLDATRGILPAACSIWMRRCKQSGVSPFEEERGLDPEQLSRFRAGGLAENILQSLRPRLASAEAE